MYVLAASNACFFRDVSIQLRSYRKFALHKLASGVVILGCSPFCSSREILLLALNVQLREYLFFPGSEQLSIYQSTCGMCRVSLCSILRLNYISCCIPLIL